MNNIRNQIKEAIAHTDYQAVLAIAMHLRRKGYTYRDIMSAVERACPDRSDAVTVFEAMLYAAEGRSLGT